MGKLKARLALVEERLQEREAQLKSLEAATLKDHAVLTQNLEFASSQAEDLKTQLEEEREQHASLMRTLQTSTSGSSREEVDSQIEKLKNKYI